MFHPAQREIHRSFFSAGELQFKSTTCKVRADLRSCFIFTNLHFTWGKNSFSKFLETAAVGWNSHAWSFKADLGLHFWFQGSSKITADGDCSHEIKRNLFLGRKVMTNLDSILKSRDITLPTKVRLVKAMVFPVVMYGCESWTVKKAECRRIDAFEL